MKYTKRSTYCGHLSKNETDQTVTLNAWVHRRRDHGGGDARVRGHDRARGGDHGHDRGYGRGHDCGYGHDRGDRAHWLVVPDARKHSSPR